MPTVKTVIKHRIANTAPAAIEILRTIPVLPKTMKTKCGHCEKIVLILHFEHATACYNYKKYAIIIAFK